MKKTISNLTAILLSLLLLTSACQPAESTASPLTGVLSELKGKVDAKQADEEQFNPVTAGTTLQVNGQVQTGEDGHVRIDLSSGTIIRVVPSSLFTLVSNEAADGGLATKLELGIGRLFILLNGGSLDVETPSGVASVRGSFMMVYVTHNLDAIITCLEGDCHADNEAGQVNFTDGQKTTLFHFDPATGKPIAPKVEDMNEDDYQDWRDENPDRENFISQLQSENEEPPAATPTLITIVPNAPATEAPVASTTCFKVIYPQEGTSLPHNGPVTFVWEEQSGASMYVVTFHFPNGLTLPFQTTETELTRFMDTMPDGGDYLWDVTALDGNGNEICRTQGVKFTKPSSHPEDLVEPKEEEQQCTVGQNDNSNMPCYCNPEDPTPPPYCYQPGY